jgi:hypothetical protein
MENIDLKVDKYYVDDLRDDLMVNTDLDLYEFIGNDPVRAFYLGINMRNWFDELDKDQQYLYSKQLRHNKDDLEKYENQIKFWTDKYPEKGEVNLAELAEYIMNNLFYDEETEESDKVKFGFFFGDMIAQSSKTSQDE